MPLLKATPILAYLDRDTTVSFYEKLGFESNTSYEGYLMFSKDLISIHLWRCDDESIPKNTGCYVYVDEIDALYKECEALGIVHPNGKLQYMAGGLRQFSILDNSGNIIHFGQDMKS